LTVYEIKWLHINLNTLDAAVGYLINSDLHLIVFTFPLAYWLVIQ